MLKSQLHELRKYAGDLSGLYGIKEYCFSEGRARGMRAIEVNNGNGLVLTFLPDRCLDIPYLSYKGTNIGLVTKVGLSAPSFYSPDARRGFLTQFNAGLLTTCGIMNAGTGAQVDGRFHPMHGEIGNMPCINVNKEELVVDDEIVLAVSGEARQACVFGEYVTLTRLALINTQSNAIIIRDTVENKGFSPVPVMNLYHTNFGYPILDEGAKIYFSANNVQARDAIAKAELHKHNIIEAPEPGRPEACFTHTGGEGMQFAMLHNEKLALAAVVKYNAEEFPFLHEWKSMGAGDYALGLEPSAAGFDGLAGAIEKGLIKYLEPGESRKFSVIVEVLDDMEEIHEYIEKAAR